MSSTKRRIDRWHKLLGRMNACKEAVGWSAPYATLEEAWGACPRGDWLLWLAARLKVDRRHVVAAACACAQGVLHLVPEGEERPRRAVETAIAWTRGEATIEEVRAAADAADAAARAARAAANDAARAASAAAWAAAYAAARAASWAAWAAANDAARAARAASAAAWESALRQCAERVREAIPWEMIAEAVSHV